MLPVTANHFKRTDHTEQRVDPRHLSFGHGRLVAPFASDPELTMRREIKLLRIEVEQTSSPEGTKWQGAVQDGSPAKSCMENSDYCA